MTRLGITTRNGKTRRTVGRAWIDRVAGLLRVPGLLRKTRVLLIGRNTKDERFFCDGTLPAKDPQKVKAALGVEIVEATGQDVRQAYEAVDMAAAELEAEQYWIKPAGGMDAPRRDVIGSARVYLALKNLMIAANA